MKKIYKVTPCDAYGQTNGNDWFTFDMEQAIKEWAQRHKVEVADCGDFREVEVTIK